MGIGDEKIEVSWETACPKPDFPCDNNIDALKIYRSTTPDNKQLIHTSIGQHEWIDTNVENGITYYYWLEVIRTSSEELHGPKSTDTGFTPTETPTPGGGTVFHPIEDARIKIGSSSNYGSSDYLPLRDGEYESYLKFNVSGISGTVTNAKLRLYAYDGSPDAGTVYSVSNSWEEDEIDSGNAPNISGTALDSGGSVDDDEWVEYDVSIAVNGNGIFSFGLTSNDGNSARFNSREASNNLPQLVLEIDGSSPPPTPTPGSPTDTPSPPPTDTPEPGGPIFSSIEDARVKLVLSQA